jgi:hypothetical protein
MINDSKLNAYRNIIWHKENNSQAQNEYYLN